MLIGEIQNGAPEDRVPQVGGTPDRLFRRFLPSRGRMCELRKAEGETGRAGQPWAKDAIAIPVSRLMSGQATGKTSVPWMVPMTWRHLACTPERKSSR